MPSSVVVTAPARLHLGFLDMHGGLGRRFGSLGLTIEGFATRVRIEPASETMTVGEAEIERAARVLDVLRRQWDVPHVRLTIERTIPAHVGMGSGTQLGLAVGTALATLFDVQVGPAEIARLLERGARSGIGIGAFSEGGFILDGGKDDSGDPPPVTARLPVPKAWRVLVILDPAHRGLHGAAELDAFRTLDRFSAETAAELCRLVVMRLLPGLATADLGPVGSAIGEIQRRVGDHFAPAQGGRFTSAPVARVLEMLAGDGIAGVGQSSWGPTGFALLPDEATARELAGSLARQFASLHFEIVAARNRGAEITPGG
ncbi:MAG: beta-ribofuranosylaminobenzene 5'-phosphate synthase family protein [Geminicoccaceae bacterium]